MDYTSIEHQFTTAEAVAFVKRAEAGTKFCAYVRADAAIEGEPEKFFHHGCFSYVQISRKDAERLARDMLSPTLEGRGGRIVVRVSDRFNGKKTIWF